MAFNQAQVQTDHSALKTLESAIATNFATLQANLRQHADLCADMAAVGGNAGAEWHRIQITQMGMGYQPKAWQNDSPSGNPAQTLPRLVIYANDATRPRDLSQLGDQRPVSAFDPSLT